MTAARLRRWPAVATLLCLCSSTAVFAHGGVVSENDLCIINIGYLKAHFKIYVPAATAHEEYCEDIPIRGESVFIMEYQHDGLSAAEIDFRIVRNVTGKGIYARSEDVANIDDLDAITVHYAPAAVSPDVYMLLHDFESDGEYIGIVTAATADNGKTYTAVFPFEVGDTGIGVWPWILGGLLVLQLNFWFWSRRRKPAAGTTAVLLLALLPYAPLFADDDTWPTDAGHFSVSYQPDLDPLQINKIHTWMLTVNHADGTPVANATVTLDGGMPSHNHGLPTHPAVLATAKPGEYRVAGMRFHMQGDWVITIKIDDGEHRDMVMIPLRL